MWRQLNIQTGFLKLKLRDFPYNVGFQPMLFLMAALLSIIIAMVTVTITSLKAARINPAVALHYE